MVRSFVGTELDTRSPASHSGFVDIIDRRSGVRGWAVNLTDPMSPVLLQLCVGDQVVAETLADGEREDISAKLGRPARAGFSFGAEVMLSLASYLDDPEDLLVVRVAETGYGLTGADPSPTISEILNQLRADSAPQLPNSTEDLELLLEELRQSATDLAEYPLRPVPESLQGYVETIAVDASGLVWFMGWMKRGHIQEFAAVLVERRKYPAAVAVMGYARDDLPPDASGVVGLISSDWRPSSATGDLVIFFGAGGRFHLRSNSPLRLVTSGELVGEYENIRDVCLADGRAAALQRMLTALESWLPTRTAGQWYATESSVDRVLLVPGLGCFVEGWVLSPMKRIEGLRLRVGGAVMLAHQDSLYWKPRRDLLAAFPGSERMVERAGFVGLFLGVAEPEDFAEPMLKVIFQGGMSANFVIEPRKFRRLGHSAGLEDAQLFFPALQEEAFFPRFAAAAIRADRAAMNPPVPITIERSRRVMVFVLPEDRCDLFLLFEELTHRGRVAGGTDSLVFVAASNSNRADALWLFRDFQRTEGAARNIACSLLVIDDASQAFALLPDILRAVGANRFFFAGPGIFPNEDGWARARQALAHGATDLVFFGIEPEEFDRSESSDAVSARCFAWSAGHFSRWALQAPAFLGGFYRDNGMLQASLAHVVHHHAVRSARTLFASRIQEAVNATVYAQASQIAAARQATGRTPQRALAAAVHA